MDNAQALARINALPLWGGPIDIEPLGGGRTNLNFTVTGQTGKFVVRIGEDIPEHHVMRFNELAASRAAHAAGLSPGVVHAQPGLSVLQFIKAKTLDEPDIGAPGMLERIVPLVRRCHHDIPVHLRGPALIFWVFHVIRDYANTLEDGDSPHGAHLADFRAIAEQLAAASGPFDIVFGHNDLMAPNFLDDGNRLWLIDWDYAGYNTPLFDLGGLASNNLLNEAQEAHMLELYFEAPVKGDLMHRYTAMKCASLLRETMWSMVSESTSSLDVDYAAYTSENLTRFRQAHQDYLNS